MNKNKEMLQKIIDLQKDNPDAEIIFSVNNDTMCYDYNCTIQEIESVKFNDLYITGDGTHFSGEEDTVEYYERYEDDENKILEFVKSAHKGKAIFVELSA